MSIPAADRPLRELAQRTNSGLVVSLFWDPVEDKVLLRVEDLASGTTTERELHPGNERFAYEHPFAYLASGSPTSRPSTAAGR